MKTILLIEDDTALRENTAELLELEDYKVHTAPNGKIGIETAKEVIPDLIICDIMMPEIDGYGVLEAVSLDAATAHIPFVFLSAKTEHKEVRKGMDLGADDYLTKPFEEEDLLSSVESRLAKAKILADIKEQTSKKKDNPVANLDELKKFFKDQGTIKPLEKGAVLFREGAYSTQIYLILEGVVKITRMEESGKELITALHKKDDFLGFTSFADNIPYQETATAVEDSKIIGIAKENIRTILGNNQNVSLEFVNILTENISEIKEQLLQMAYSSVRKKTAQTILHFAKIMNKNPEDAIKIARNDLASVAGIATESLIRTISEFKKKGFIEIEGRNIKILQLESLENVE